MLPRTFCFAFSFLCFAPASFAAPASKEDLHELSTTLGRAHAIQILCHGSADQFWRDYMLSFLDLEAPEDGDNRNNLVDAFNAGFDDQTKKTPECDARAKAAFAEISQSGARLSEALNAKVTVSD